jgi:uncharacterized membrane protein
MVDIIYELNKVRNLRHCHRIPERSLNWGKGKMPMCARCFGIRIGTTTAIILCVLQKLPPWWISFLMFLVLLIDWGIQQFFNVMSTNLRRVISGVVGGFGMGALFWGTASFCAQWTLAWVIRWTVEYVTH